MTMILDISAAAVCLMFAFGAAIVMNESNSSKTRMNIALVIGVFALAAAAGQIAQVIQ